MIKNLSPIERMLAVSIGFNFVLLAVRVVYTMQPSYTFYVWNTILAVMPLVFSRQLQHTKSFNKKAYALLAGWLVFFPNAPYIVTDILHYYSRPPVPKWFDLLLVTSGAWNGMVLGVVSLLQVEAFLSKHIKAHKVQRILWLFIILCGYGIYIGRFLRFNSWDVVTNPDDIAYTCGMHFLQPHQHVRVWAFTLLFALLFGIVYYTIRNISKGIRQPLLFK